MAEATGRRELITTNTPRTIYRQAASLIGDNFVVSCPVYDDLALPGIDDKKAAQQREQFLQALWRSWRFVGQTDTFNDMRFNLIVRGKLALYASWIYKDMPASLQPYRPPVLFRSLNPTQVGHYSDDVGTRIAYHTYTESYRKLRLRYPQLANLTTVKGKHANDKVRFTDYWEMDAAGQVWNAHLIDNKEFLREPAKSTMPLIPIIVRAAEVYSLDPRNPTPESGADNTELASHSVLSILDDILGEWEVENILESMMVTGIKENFWPAKFVRDTTGAEVPDIELGADAINEVGAGFEFVNPPPFTPDYQNATMLAERTHRRVERGGFPDANYGQSDAAARSGYLFNQLSQAGQGIIGGISRALSRAMIEANTLALCMVDKFAAGDVTVYAYDEGNRGIGGYTLGSEQTSDRYINHVTIKPARSSNDAQMAALGLQAVAAGLMSDRTWRKELAPIEMPADEEQQIFIESIYDDPDLRKERVREAFYQEYGYELPPAEPDWKETPPQQQQPGDPMQLQPPQAMPGVALPPQAQGQLTPEDVTGNANVDPSVFDTLMGR